MRTLCKLSVATQTSAVNGDKTKSDGVTKHCLNANSPQHHGTHRDS